MRVIDLIRKLNTMDKPEATVVINIRTWGFDVESDIESIIYKTVQRCEEEDVVVLETELLDVD